ncbi:MAG: hypothetical protein N2578_05215 [Bdellovibrionaceae bacterium]|nr:hypothetical protein [Pseudobdellovibrionaceae bacterium]
MELLQQLGIDETAIYQFFMFVSAVSFLSIFVFRPYYEAFEKRLSRTKGNEEITEELAKKSVDLHSEYENRVREVHSSIHAIYSKKKTEALAEYDKIVAAAREEAARLAENNKKNIAMAVAAAAQGIKQEASTLATTITNKLLGKA